MPKFAASLVCPVDSPPRKNAVVEIGNDGVILSVSDGTDAFRESAGVVFYSGILIPGLCDLMCGTVNPHWQYSRGIRLAGTSGLPEGAGNENFPNSWRGLPRNNDNHLDANRYRWTGMYGEVVDYVAFDGLDHFSRYFKAGGHSGLYHPLTESDGLPVLATGGQTDMMGLLIELHEGPAQICFHVLLEMASLNGAIAAGYNNTAGSLSKGKQPGLCIIEGADIVNMVLLKGSRLRRLL